MYKALDIARKLLKMATERDNCFDLMSNMKLQKMLYYQQGYHLAVFDEPLFEEKIEAWMYGPVVPCVFEEYKNNGRKGIEYNGDVITLQDEEEELFCEVFETYAKYSAYGLSNMTHNEEPWKSVSAGKGNVISNDVMKSFFKTMIE